jgi:hypothetical protein
MGDTKGQIFVKLNMSKVKGLKEEIEIERLHKGMKKGRYGTIIFVEKCCHQHPLRKTKQKVINRPSIIFVMVAKIFL